MAPQSFFYLGSFLYITSIFCASLPTKCKLQRRLMETCYVLLDNMGGLYPLECFENSSLVPFPKTAFETTNSTTHQEISVEKSIYISLIHVFFIFNNYGIPNEWDPQMFEDFQNIIYRQIEESKCIMNKREDPLDFLRRETALSAYYKQITTFLKQKDYKYCAWEFVRTEMIRILQLILRIEHRLWSNRL